MLICKINELGKRVHRGYFNNNSLIENLLCRPIKRQILIYNKMLTECSIHARFSLLSGSRDQNVFCDTKGYKSRDHS